MSPDHVTVTPDEFAADIDLQFHCAALSLGMAAALLTGDDEAVGIMSALMTDWPVRVPEHAAHVGYRVAMLLAEAWGKEPNDLGALSAFLLEQQATEVDG
jgi:hypothetical protein